MPLTGTIQACNVGLTEGVQEIMQGSLFLRGSKEILPVAAAGIIDGIVFGILARQAGIGLLETMLFSLLVNAGSSQFAAVGLISQGIVGWPMLVSTAFLNARHLLYGLALGPAFRNVEPLRLTLVGGFLNDETYALKATYLASGRQPSLAYFFGASFTDYLIWNGSTLLGAVFVMFIPEPEAFGLDFAFLATFIGFLAINLTSRFLLQAAVVASLVACLAYWWNGPTPAIIAGTLAAVLLGVLRDE